MKISVSNIAWHDGKLENFLQLLESEKCHGVEIAPSKIWNNLSDIKVEQINSFNSLIKKYNLELVGFHSLLYGMPELKIFTDEESRIKTKNFLFNLIELCSKLRGNQLIFGSPKNRETYDLPKKEVEKISHDFFIEIANHSKKNNVYFCIEPLGKDETNFINSVSEGGEFVKDLNHSNFRLLLDTKAIFFSQENPLIVLDKYQKYIQHIHVSDQDLKEPGTINKNHSDIAKAIKNISYNKFLSLEMRRVSGDEVNSIKRSIKFIKKNYLN